MRNILNRTTVDSSRLIPAFAEPDRTLHSRTCPLAACQPGSRATVVDIACSADEGCRLRALGLYEGCKVSVVDSRHCMVLDVRGTRLALSKALTTGITVQPDALRG